MYDPGLLLIAGLLSAAGTAFAMPECAGDWEHKATLIDGSVAQDAAFEIDLADDLSFRLQRRESHWHIDLRTLEAQSIPIRKISQGVAPVRGSNPLVQRYGFGPDVLDPALNPELTVPAETANAATVEPTPGIRGQLWLDTTEPAAQGQFRACVRWTYWPREPNIGHYPTPEMLADFPRWVVMAFEDCGLPDTLLLSGRMASPGARQRAWLEPDLDGDGLYDLLALVEQPDTGRSGLAVCSQSDQHLDVLGIDPRDAPEDLSSDFLAELDWWSVASRTVLLGIEGAGSQKLYRDQHGALTSEWVGD